jgi:hypothetical protein
MIQYSELLRQGVIGEVSIQEHIEAIKTKNRYEYIPDEIPLKVYYDFDYELENTESFNLDISNEVLKRILLLLSIYWKKKIGLFPIYSVLQSHRLEPIIKQIDTEITIVKPPKYSFHIVLVNISAIKSLQKHLLENEINTLLIECGKIQDYLENTSKIKLDEAVYGKGRQKLRCINAIKEDEPNRPLLLISSEYLHQLPKINDIYVEGCNDVVFEFTDKIEDTVICAASNTHTHSEEIVIQNATINYESFDKTSKTSFHSVINSVQAREKYFECRKSIARSSN